jgi:hypothetical protein
MFIDPRLSRRRALVLAGAALPLALAACGGTLAPVITAPPGPTPLAPPTGGLSGFIAEAGALLAKVESVRSYLPAAAQNLLDTGKSLLATVTSTQAVGTAKTLVTTLASLATLLPPPYDLIGLAVKTLLPLIGGIIGLRMAAVPTGMTEAQARAIIAAR